MTATSTAGLVLFDIDDTLVNVGGAARAALDRAFADTWGIEQATAGITCAGRTDPQIVRDVLGRLNITAVKDQERMVKGILGAYLSHLPDCMAKEQNFKVLPGVLNLLPRLVAHRRFVLALATGNVAPGARLKLAKAQLNRFFRTGGFGNDAAVHAGILAVALQRVAQIVGRPVSRTKIFHIGDSAQDMKAARATGIVPIGVTTGIEDEDSLKSAGAEHVLSSLGDVKGLLQIMGS